VTPRLRVTPATPTDGAAVLDRALALLLKYCQLPSDEAGHAIMLWAACTHALPALPAAPRLAITSAVKRSGKTRVLDIVEGLVHEPLVTMNATVAAVFRSLGVDHPPTLIVDEVDTIFGSKRVAENNEDLRGLINAGFQRGKDALRCVGPSQIPTLFPTFAMAALAGIGGLPDTIVDRSVTVRMKRRRPGETVSPFRERRDRPALEKVRGELCTWLAGPAVQAELADAEPVDLGLEDRAADVWEPLIMVADLAGGHWPDRARAAGKKLTDDNADDERDDSEGIRLLHDLRDVFGIIQGDFAPTDVLLQHLRAIDDAPWRDADLNGHRLGRELRVFGIRSSRDSAGAKRGYKRNAFTDAWERYPLTERDSDA
jgi:hypothetical protein